MRWTYDEDTRWAAAWTVLHRAPTDEARGIRTADQWRTAGISIGVGVLTVVALTTAGLGALLFDRAGTDPTGWWRTPLAVVGYGLTVLGLLVAIPRRYGLDRIPGLTAQAPADVLNRSQREALDRQITGADPLDPDLLPLAFDRAARRINRPLPVAQAATGGILLGSVTLRGAGATVLVLWVVTLVVLAILIPQQLAARSAAQAFVDHYGSAVR